MSSSTTRFAADYAKRVAGCRKCKLQLPKGEMRLAKIIPNPFVQNTEGPPPDMKQYYHPHCLFEMFFKARASTKVIESTDDIEECNSALGFGDLRVEDKEVILKFIDELDELRAQKEGGTKKTPRKMGNTSPAKISTSATETIAQETSEGSKDQGAKEKHSSRRKNAEKVALEKEVSGAAKQGIEANEDSKYNSFNKLCDVIASLSKYTDKSAAVKMFITRDDYDGDMLTLIRLLLPSVDQRVYNVKEKQIINHFATIDRWLNKLTELSKDDEQIAHLKFAAKRLALYLYYITDFLHSLMLVILIDTLSPVEIQYLLRLVMKDLRINAGVKHILDGLHSSAYEAFQNCRDLAEIVERQVCKKDQFAKVPSVVEVSIRLGTPVLPMLAEPCKSVEQAMKRCINGMFAEIKYDGERVQISHLENVIPKAFPKASELIIDAEISSLISEACEMITFQILLVDNATGKPLPFGTLGVHKKEKFKDASVCLFVFDILLYNNEDLMMRQVIGNDFKNSLLKSLSERKKLLESQMMEVKNRVVMSNYQLIRNGDNGTLKTMIWKAIDEGLEGLVLKDTKSIYEPGKRHWLKVKKDYLEDGRMADTADLLLLGAYFGTGSKGGTMSVFLMGVYDSESSSYRTVTKCGNGHSDDDLNAINEELRNKDLSQVTRIDRDYDRLPKWLRCSRSLVPDFVIVDPENAPVWEITGTTLFNFFSFEILKFAREKPYVEIKSTKRRQCSTRVLIGICWSKTSFYWKWETRKRRVIMSIAIL
ncbi:unnamed protein product [Angiostrongylus costaricensis]|uniref:DNA ligase n=1 Tax=Angiostrongylus costaricensis TaxID=334426 RepID=A0A158PIC7_ANGCS|nr:unnamed protein product [Angiostrongylus costaricensis]